MSKRFPEAGARVVAMVDDALQPAIIIEALRGGTYLVELDDGARRILSAIQVGDPTPLSEPEEVELRLLAQCDLAGDLVHMHLCDRLIMLRSRVAMARVLPRLEAMPLMLNARLPDGFKVAA